MGSRDWDGWKQNFVFVYMCRCVDTHVFGCWNMRAHVHAGRVDGVWVKWVNRRLTGGAAASIIITGNELVHVIRQQHIHFSAPSPHPLSSALTEMGCTHQNRQSSSPSSSLPPLAPWWPQLHSSALDPTPSLSLHADRHSTVLVITTILLWAVQVHNVFSPKTQRMLHCVPIKGGLNLIISTQWWVLVYSGEIGSQWWDTGIQW